jgi:hypothetical protein
VASSAGLDANRLAHGMKQRQKALTDARNAMLDLDDPGAPEDGELPEFSRAVGDVIEAATGERPAASALLGRGDNMLVDRRRIRRVVAEVTVAKADPKRRRWQPIAERVSVRWVGETSS